MAAEASPWKAMFSFTTSVEKLVKLKTSDSQFVRRNKTKIVLIRRWDLNDLCACLRHENGIERAMLKGVIEGRKRKRE